MSGWSYLKSGVMQDETVGPISDQEFLKLAFDGAIKGDTPVAHTTHTKAKWVIASSIPAAQERIQQGQLQRQQQKMAAKHEQQERKAAMQAEAAARKTAAIQQAAERKANSPIAQFLLDGQSESAVEKIYDRVSEILTSTEKIEYISIQAKPVQVAPDCIVLTNRRFIVFRQKILGRMSFDDYIWRELHDARIHEGVMFAAITMQAMNGRKIKIEYLPKAQARRIYRIAQEREEAALEERRDRNMEESKAAATNIVVNAPVETPEAKVATEDSPMEKLTKLKQMLDTGLIEQDDFDKTKQRLLDSM